VQSTPEEASGCWLPAKGSEKSERVSAKPVASILDRNDRLRGCWQAVIAPVSKIRLAPFFAELANESTGRIADLFNLVIA
jgi:hypothetical protein